MPEMEAAPFPEEEGHLAAIHSVVSIVSCSDWLQRWIVKRVSTILGRGRPDAPLFVSLHPKDREDDCHACHARNKRLTLFLIQVNPGLVIRAIFCGGCTHEHLR